MELFLGQLIDVLEGEGRKNFSAAALQRWSDLCAQRMLETGSAPQQVITQLRMIATRVTTQEPPSISVMKHLC